MTAPSTLPNESFAIVLQPDDTTTEALVQYGNSLHELSPSEIRLKASSPFPHLTVAHFNCDGASAQDIWATTEPWRTQQWAVDPHVAYLRSHHDHLAVGLMTHHTRLLNDFHLAALQACAQAGATVTSDARDHYWPHITIARWAPMTSTQIALEPALFGSFSAIPVLARIGQYGTAIEVVAK